jgi:RNA polymerase sigma-70 factor, ECF subfamily
MYLSLKSKCSGEMTALTVTSFDRDAERALILKAQGGDTKALDDLIRAHRDRMWGVCRRITGSDADAQDATQEASIAIMRHIAKFDGNSAFSTWVYRIATNASLDELRRRKRRPVAMDDSGFEMAGTRPAGIAAFAQASNTGFDRRIADRLMVDAALAKLPPDFRAAVVLRDLCDLDYGEIAEVLGIPAGTVRSRIARGRAALGPIMIASGEHEPDEPSDMSSDMTTDTLINGNQPGSVVRLPTQESSTQESSTQESSDTSLL